MRPDRLNYTWLRWLTICCFLPAAALAQLPGASQQKRVEPVTVQHRLALVIGNGAYQNLQRIPQSLNDADDMTATLRGLGFTVTEYKDLQIEPLIRAVTSFRATVQQNDLALVYYSGHGGQWGEENYLLPIEYEPPSPQEAEFVARRALPMSMIRDGIEKTARVRVLIFDACRSSPLLSSKDTPGGLQKINIRPEGTLVAYASADQQGSGFHTDRRNSDYTELLLKSLKQTQLPDIKALFEQVQIQLYEASNKTQTPYLYGFLSGPLYLGKPPSETRPIANEAIDLDLERYTAVKESRDPDQLEEVANKLRRVDLAEILRDRARAMRSVSAPPAIATNKLPPPPNHDELTKSADAAFESKDYNAAFGNYLKLAQDNDPWGELRLGYLYNLGLGVTQDYGQAAAWYRKAADQGRGVAMRDLGILYEDGHGVAQNYATALSWYRKAADAGDSGGMNNIGSLYENGEGVPKDINQALIWYRKAADAGDSNAKTNVARLAPAPVVPAQIDKDALTKSADAAYDRKDYTSALRDYRKLAQANDSWGQLRLGFMYNMGYGTTQDYAEAAAWYRKSADLGRAMAMRDLGLLYEHGRGLKQDYSQAAIWYQKAADAGDEGGMNDLGILYENGTGVPKNLDKALELYKKAAAAGDESAKTNVTRLTPAPVDKDALTKSADAAYDRKDYTSAFNDYKKLAQANDAWGQLRLGFMYHQGYGTTQDYAQAAVWYRKSADQGRAMAMRDLGILYEHGNGVAKDYNQAVYWYRKAADAGDEGGMNDLAIMYEDGYGVPKDVEQAVTWYKKAAALGDENAKTNLTRLGRLDLPATERDQLTKSADAAYDRKDYTSAFNDYTKLANANDAWGQLRLGFMYNNGWGTTQNYPQAAVWYRKAADAGRTMAMRNLGILYDEGKGVTKDYAQALFWYRKAANAGDAGSMNNLGILYEYGYGVPKDINQAVSWYTKAAAGGDENGKTNLKRLGR